MSDDVIVIDDDDDEEEERAGSQQTMKNFFKWPRHKKHRPRPSKRALEDDLTLPPPSHERPSLAQAHFGAAVVGEGSHPAAHLFEVIDGNTSCKVKEKETRKQKLFFSKLGKKKVAFSEMLDDLWPAHVQKPDELSHRLLFEAAVRFSTELIGDREPVFSSRHNLDNGVLYEDFCKKMGSAAPDELLQAVFGEKNFSVAKNVD